MGVWNPGQEAGVHADTRGKLHKPRHGGTLKMGSGRSLVLLGIDIFHYHCAGGIHEITVEIGGMFFFLLLNPEVSYGRIMTFTACGTRRDPYKFASLVVVHFLISDIDDHVGRTAD